MSSKDARVVVVGAGAAGLSAAHHLVQNGFSNVIVLEATNRIGGRIHTVEFGDGIIELGANWIHGTGKENSMYTLAKEKGLIMEPYVFLDSEKEMTLTERGTEIDKITVKKAWKIIEKIEDELEDGISYKKDLNCQDYIEKRFTEEIEKRKMNEEKKTQMQMFCKLMSGYLGVYVGDDLKLASAKCYEMGGEYDDDDDVILSHGYSLLLKALQDDLTDSNVKFNRNVVSIQWKSEQSTVKVICESQDKTIEEYIADHVIVTCSLGHLKQNHDNIFHPSLPDKKIKAIERMGFGSVGKIFLYYEIPFWRKEDSGILLAWDSSDDDSTSWYKSIFKFSTIPTCKKVLLAWIHGKASKHMETLSMNEVARTCTEILRKFWKNKEIPEPTLTQTSSWSRDPSFLGAYSYFAVDSHKSCISDIAEPLFVADKPIVCFAGEATHSKWFSYTHGARSSGIREANRILNLSSPSK